MKKKKVVRETGVAMKSGARVSQPFNAKVVIVTINNKNCFVPFKYVKKGYTDPSLRNVKTGVSPSTEKILS